MRSQMHRWSPRAARASAVALLACGTFAAVAVAATINGNNGDNALVGTGSADSINGRGGNDQIFGNGGDDFIDGGPGSDDYNHNNGWGLVGGSGSDRISGGDGDDDMDGDYRDCAPVGLSKACAFAETTLVTAANAGNDYLSGGPGDDKLYGQERDDVLIGGPGEDYLTGEAHDDSIYARDGQEDLINCGSGVDRVQWDKGLDHFQDNNFNDVGTAFPNNCEGELLL